MLDNVTWPAGLQSLTLGDRFDQNLDNVTWPASLQSLTFGEHFDQSLDNVTLPAGLENLAFHTFSAEKLNGVLPEGLQSLSFLKRDFDSADSASRLASEVMHSCAGWPRALRKLFFCDLALVC